MTTPATTARGVRQATFSRDDIITALRRYAALYGPDFTAAAFSPSTAKWRDDAESIERYYAGDPETGVAWPSLNAIKSHFGGSFNAAREAAGLPRNRPGPGKRGKRKAGEHAPVRDVSHVGATRVVFVEKEGEESARTIERLRGKVTRLEKRLEAALAAASKPKVETKTKTVVKEVRSGADRAEGSRAKRMAERAVHARDVARAEMEAAREASREAKTTATRLAARLERAEATISTLREERRSLKAALDRAEDRMLAAERALEAERERAIEPEVRETVRVVERAGPGEVEMDAMRAETRAANARALEAERRAVAAERRERETVALVTGEERRLSPAEVAALREGGPQGPAVLARAVTELAKARKRNSTADIKAALGKVAAAAVGWRETLR